LRQGGEPHVWVTSPLKTWRSEGGVDSVPFEQLWADHILRNPLLRGPFLVEPQVPHDQELCVLCINGGRLLILAGRSLCMERIVRIRGEGRESGGTDGAFISTPSDFGTPDWLYGDSIRNWRRADVATRRLHAQRCMEQLVEGDERGRTIAQVLLDTSELLASQYFDGRAAAAIRVDWFVRWGSSGDQGAQLGERSARVWVNEVENGFNPCSLVGWYGERLTMLALRFWAAGGCRGAAGPPPT